MGKSIFGGWLAEDDPRWGSSSICVGSYFSLAGRPLKSEKAQSRAELPSEGAVLLKEKHQAGDQATTSELQESGSLTEESQG